MYYENFLDFLEEYKVSILLLFVVLLLSTSLYVVINSNRTITNNYISMILIEKDGMQSEILVDIEKSITIKKTPNGEEIISNFPRDGVERLALPNLDIIEAKDTLDGKLQSNKLVWDSTFIDSFKYIKYLIIKENYKIDMYASTPQFIELFLSNDNQEYYRIVIFPSSIMKAKSNEKFNFPTVESYLEIIKK